MGGHEMPIQCAWCGSKLGEDARLTNESHGICASCERNNFPGLTDPAAGAARGPEHPENA